MNKLLLTVCLFVSLLSFSQSDSAKWIRGFPITEYMLDSSDSVKIIQVHLPAGLKIADKQIGLLKGIYRDKHSDTSIIGSGRCNLVKGDYYYFTINHKQSGREPREGDLLYAFM